MIIDMKSLKTVALGVIVVISFIFVINELSKVLVSIRLSSQLAQVGGGVTHYIRAGTSGNGSDWTNAYGSLPSSLVRGDTYYIADGNYGAYTFDDANSGSTYITIKKATANDHGTITGWQDSYGDGQAVFDATLRFVTDYYTFDGQTRSGWRSGHGFKISNYPCRDDWGITVGLGFGDPAHNITVRYTEIEGSRVYDDSCGDEGIQLMWESANTTIEYSWLHEFDETPILARRNDNFLFQYNWVEKNDSSPARHSEAISINEDVDNLIIRYNVFGDMEGTGYIATPGNAFLYDNSNWYIYGNTFYMSGNSGREGVGNGPIAFFYAGITGDTFVYNNTFVNFNDVAVPGSYTFSGIYIEGTSRFERLYVRNNLWWNSNQVTVPLPNATDFRWENNAYFDTATTDTDSGRQTATGNPFVNSGAQDFHLNRATNAGATLPAPYNTDPDGKTRGSSGVWDRGAYEYGGIVTPTNGQCGTTQNACTAGMLNDTADSSTDYLWQCVGSNGGSTASCSLPKPTTQYTLTVSKGSSTGSGTVTGTGINCGSDCSETFNSGASVTLTAFSASGSTFGGWSGACSSITTTCAVTMNSTQSVTATFNTATANQPPTVNAGVDRAITLPTNSISLSGTAADDGLPTGSTVTATWSKVSGAGTVTFNNTNALTTTATFSTAGTYVLRLSASDSQLSASDDITITFTVVSDDLLNGLVAHWKFDEGSGTSVSDSSGHGNIATLANGPVWSIGKFSQALRFDGIDDVARTPALSLGNTFTLTAWVRPALFFNGWGAIAAESNVGGLFTYNTLNGGVFDVYEGTSNLGSLIAPNQWYFVTIISNGTNKYLYVNGSLDKTFSTSTAWAINYIGNDNLNEAFNGLIDEVRLYNRTLTTTEVQKLYNLDANQPTTNTLTVTKNGIGTITSSPAGINCGSDCSENYSSGTNITLTANTSSGSTFSGWSGGGCSGTGACSVTINSTVNVVAMFNSTNIPPILSAIGSKSVNENETLTFTVSATDANGDSLTYSASGLPAGADFNPSLRRFSFTPSYTQAGSYLVTFSVSDEKGGTDSEIVTVTVANTNRAPMANAGNDQTVTLPEDTTLSGISSSDPDGNTLTYAWTKVSGPTSTVANPSAVSTSVSFTTQGTYIFRLTVSDGTLDSADNVTITVVPIPSGSTDSDNDGVVDASDKCGNTPPGKTVNAVGCPLPKSSRFTTKTDLTSVDLNAVSSFESGNVYGKVTWNQGSTPYILIHSNNELDIDANLDITYGTVNLNSAALPELNKPATITLYNVSVINPQILRDGDLCSGCSIISYQNNTLTFSVPGFSTYSIVSAPPIISAVASTNITSSGATISWITDVASDSRVDYGLTSAYGSQASLADSVISHSVSLVNLASNTTYHFTVLSKGTSATSGTTTDFTFTTSSGGGGDGGGGGGGGGGKKPPIAPLGMVVGCDNRTTGFSVTTGQSCASNRPIATPTSIPGCDNRTTGFSVTTGQSCVGNIPASSSGTLGPSVYNFGAVTLRNGSRGEAVKELQRFLNARLNLGLVVDGKLGPKTIAVIKQWQKDNGLVPDGLVGAKTKARMNATQ